ncbi:Asp-tRNA(Asn)/Glu-tRNA(Gln) amidotransferase A subunit family amidase [Marisediminicola sp. UYEF4]
MGGSSGGEAASLASGISSAGLGTDFGGSVRWPAQCARLVGLRPTVGRVPGSGQFPATTRANGASPNPRTLQGMLQVIGPIGRTVDDVECILRAISGPDHLDPVAVPVQLRHSSSVDIRSIECRWGTTVGPRTVSDEVAGATGYAAEILRDHCASLVESLPSAMNLAYGLYGEMRDAEPLTELRQAVAGREHMLGGEIVNLLSRTAQASDEDLARLWADRDSLRQELLQWLRGDRVLLMPVSTVAPSKLTTNLLTESRLPMSEAEIVAPSRIVSLFGLPSLSAPCGHDSAGGPLSVQLVAPPFREDLVLALGKLIFAPRQFDDCWP